MELMTDGIVAHDLCKAYQRVQYLYHPLGDIMTAYLKIILSSILLQ